MSTVIRIARLDAMPAPTMRLAALAFALALSIGCSSEPAAPSKRAAPPAEDGARVFAMACARCHAADGSGNGQLAGRLGPIPPLKSPTVSKMKHDELIGLIRSGRGAMPPHAMRLTVEQIEAVAGYVGRMNAP